MRTLLLTLAAATLSAPAAIAQRSIDFGEPVHGSLSASDPQLSDNTYFDEFAFDGRRGETVTITLDSQEFDAYLYLGTARSGRFRELSRDDDGGSGTNSRLRYTLTEDGRFVIRASSLRRDTGPYRLSLSRRDDQDYPRGGGRGGSDDDYGRGGRGDRDDDDDYGDTRRHGVESRIRANQPVRDYLSQSDPRLDNGVPFHLYRYAGRRGERVYITMHSRDFDSYLVLGTPGGRHGIGDALVRNDDGGPGLDSRIEFTLPYDGEFVIRVNPMSTEYGRYVLELQSDRRGGRDHDDDDRGPRDEGRMDARLVGLWSLTGAERYERDYGVLSVRANGDYAWRRDRQVLRGTLERVRDQQGRGYTYLLRAGRDEFLLSFIPSVRGTSRVDLIRRSTGRVVANGERYEQRRDSQIPNDDPELRIEPADTVSLPR